jgi:restriction system protein
MVQAARSGRQNIAEGPRRRHFLADGAAAGERWLDAPDCTIRANALICLIHQANFLLDRQIAALERAFVEEGGYSEQLATTRLAERRKKDPADPKKIPACPLCGGQMALRTAKAGPNTGQQFRGCTGYPDCKGTHKI